MTPSEEWRPVVGLEEMFEVSSAGRVRSLPRRVYAGPSRTRLSPGRMLSIYMGDRYATVNLKYDAKQHLTYVHRLVAAAFIGPCPDGMEVCHNDGDRLNARVENLRYDTHSANMLDRREHGTAFRRRNQPECFRGHPYTDGSFYIDSFSGKRVCLVCDSERQARRRAAERDRTGATPRAELTECKYGHPLDGRNSRQRFCITCRRESTRRSAAKRRARERDAA